MVVDNSARFGALWSRWERVNRQNAEVAKHLGREEPSTELDDLRLDLLISFNVTRLRRGVTRVIHTP
jgi:hypothetical protein